MITIIEKKILSPVHCVKVAIKCNRPKIRSISEFDFSMIFRSFYVVRKNSSCTSRNRHYIIRSTVAISK